MIQTSETTPRSRARPTLALAGMIGVAALGLAVLYGRTGEPGNGAAAGCSAKPGVLSAMSDLARGEIAALKVSRTPAMLPPLAFNGPNGEALTLADFKGKTVLLNLWATWCVPCRQEMPALARLQADMGGPDFQVVAVNIDTRNADKPKAWLADNGIQGLTYYSDPAAKVFQELKLVGKAFGMPTTLIVGPDGCELANLAGPAEWASGDGKALIGAALGRKS
jgi:thiol-disulfide isomerase/thioredoxin